MKRYTENTELAALSQRLFAVLHAAIRLENSTIKILERTTLYRERPDGSDIAEVVDAIHGVFYQFQRVTKVELWHDHEDEQDDLR